MAEIITLRAIWGGRTDSYETQANMIYQLWASLASIEPALNGDWIMTDGFDNLTNFRNPTELADRLTQADTPYQFETKHLADDETWQPYLHLEVNLGQPHNDYYNPANWARLSFEAGYTIGADLFWDPHQLRQLDPTVITAMVDAWHPDAASLRSSILMDARPRSLDAEVTPDIGYITWLSHHIVTSDQLPDAPIRYPYANGTLIGVNTTNPNPLEDALALADAIYQTGILKPLPDQQLEP